MKAKSDRKIKEEKKNSKPEKIKTKREFLSKYYPNEYARIKDSIRVEKIDQLVELITNSTIEQIGKEIAGMKKKKSK
jgi:hypothetical protein